MLKSGAVWGICYVYAGLRGFLSLGNRGDGGYGVDRMNGVFLDNFIGYNYAF